MLAIEKAQILTGKWHPSQFKGVVYRHVIFVTLLEVAQGWPNLVLTPTHLILINPYQVA